MENDRFNELADEKPILDNWQLDRPESDQVFTNMAPPPTPPSPGLYEFEIYHFLKLNTKK